MILHYINASFYKSTKALSRIVYDDITMKVLELAALHLIINHPPLHGWERAPTIVSEKLVS
jgi:hypothetical protein